MTKERKLTVHNVGHGSTAVGGLGYGEEWGPRSLERNDKLFLLKYFKVAK